MKQEKVNVPTIRKSEIKKEKKIGGGAFGVVYRGRCRGLDVAIKYLTNFDSSKKEDFIAEVDIMSNVVHPHIVLCLGACTEGNDWAMVTEFMPNGDLHEIIHEKDITLSINRKIQFAIDICSGMSWLSGKDLKILHRDLKPANVLVDANWNCKIADFGLSLLKLKGLVKKGDDGVGGSPLWMSPEALLADDDAEETEPITEKTDVYSFALVFWEILTEADLFPEYTDLSEFTTDIAIEGIRPSLEGVPPNLADIIKRCWDKKPQVRPTFKDLIPLIQQARIDINLPPDSAPKNLKGALLFKDANRMWRKNFKEKHKVAFDMFMKELFSYLKKPYSATPMKCIDALFFQNAKKSKSMTISKFGKLIKWFGPIKVENTTIIDQIIETMKQPWFFGPITSQLAEKKLKDQAPGTYLMRLNPGTNEAIEISPYTITMVDEGGACSHTRVYPSKKGGFFVKINDKQYRSPGSIRDLILSVEQEGVFKDVCPGSPYESLFQAHSTERRTAYAEAEDENP